MPALCTATLDFVKHTAPGACRDQRESISEKVESGRVFGAFDKKTRRRYFANLVKESRTLLVPSLETFFGNITYIEELTNCLTRLAKVGRGESLYTYLGAGFRRGPDAERRCWIQVDELNMVQLEKRQSDDGAMGESTFDVCYQQLWLYAFRHLDSLGTAVTPRKAGQRVDRADLRVLRRYALLARTMGFQTREIDGILSMDTDKAIITRMLDDIRDPKNYTFLDRDRAISIIQAQIDAAVIDSSADKEELDPPTKSAQLVGKPNYDDFRWDRPRMFLPQLYARAQENGGQLSSSFVAKSLYFYLLGDKIDVDFDDALRLERVAFRGNRTISGGEALSSKEEELRELQNQLSQRQVELDVQQDNLTTGQQELRDKEAELLELQRQLLQRQNELDSQQQGLSAGQQELRDKVSQTNAQGDHLPAESDAHNKKAAPSMATSAVLILQLRANGKLEKKFEARNEEDTRQRATELQKKGYDLLCYDNREAERAKIVSAERCFDAVRQSQTGLILALPMSTDSSNIPAFKKLDEIVLKRKI